MTPFSSQLFVLLLLGGLLACGGSHTVDDVGVRDGGAALDSGVLDSQVDAGADGTALDGGEPEGFTLATWNIENFPMLPVTALRVREIIERERWDLIAIQEVANDEAFHALIAALPDYEGFVSFDSRAYTRNAFLFRKDRVQVGVVDRLFRRDGYAFPRDPLFAEISFMDGDEVVFDFRLVVVHLKAQIDARSRERRRDAIEQLAEWVESTTAEGADPDVVIAGDYNDEVQDPADENVFTPFLNERFEVLSAPLAGREASYTRFNSLIDHIVVTSDAIEEYGAGTTHVSDQRLFNADYLFQVSDHLPVVSHFIP